MPLIDSSLITIGRYKGAGWHIPEGTQSADFPGSGTLDAGTGHSGLFVVSSQGLPSQHYNMYITMYMYK